MIKCPKPGPFTLRLYVSRVFHSWHYALWGVDSVKSTVSVLEEGDFSEEGDGFNWRGYFSVGGYQFLWRSAFRSRGGSLAHLE